MNIEEYIITKEKTDLLSSLKRVDNNLTQEALEEYDLENLEELRDFILEEFEMLYDMSRDDIFTQMYFTRLLENENSVFMSAYQSDIEAFYAFVYENGRHLSYYIPDEIKAIINDIGV